MTEQGKKIMINFARNMQEVMNSHGWTQKQLAERLGVSTTHLSHWMRGTRLFSVDNGIKMSEALGITIDHLIRDKE